METTSTTSDIKDEVRAALYGMSHEDTNRLLGWLTGSHPEALIETIRQMRAYDERKASEVGGVGMSTTPDLDRYTYADDDDLFIADSATVTRLLALLAPPYVGRARAKGAAGTRAKVAGICRDMEAATFGYQYAAKHGAGAAK